MNFITIIIGTAACLFGLFVQFQRVTNKSKKKESMQKFWGNKIGSYWHFISYVILPGSLGLLIIYYGLYGLSLTELLNA